MLALSARGRPTRAEAEADLRRLFGEDFDVRIDERMPEE